MREMKRTCSVGKGVSMVKVIIGRFGYHGSAFPIRMLPF